MKTSTLICLIKIVIYSIKEITDYSTEVKNKGLDEECKFL